MCSWQRPGGFLTGPGPFFGQVTSWKANHAFGFLSLDEGPSCFVHENQVGEGLRLVQGERVAVLVRYNQKRQSYAATRCWAVGNEEGASRSAASGSHHHHHPPELNPFLSWATFPGWTEGCWGIEYGEHPHGVPNFGHFGCGFGDCGSQYFGGGNELGHWAAFSSGEPFALNVATCPTEDDRIDDRTGANLKECSENIQQEAQPVVDVEFDLEVEQELGDSELPTEAEQLLKLKAEIEIAHQRILSQQIVIEALQITERAHKDRLEELRRRWTIVREALRPLCECPITGEAMQIPYQGLDGHMYDRDAILRWLGLEPVSPFTRQRMPPGHVCRSIFATHILEIVREHFGGP